jgi:lipid A ethanolaminephosphotransferase
MTLRFSNQRLAVLVALFVTLTGNLTFFAKTFEAFADQPGGYLHVVSLGLLLFLVMALVFLLLAVGRATRPVLAAMLLIAAPSAYFMDAYHVILDSDMIANATMTDGAEIRDLLTARLLGYLLVLGIVPAVLLYRLPRSVCRPWREELYAQARWAGGVLAAAVALLLLSGGFYASFFREHKPLRYYTNPLTPVYSAARYVARSTTVGPTELVPIGQDARIAEDDRDRELVVLVVGETARADHFSLNGYARPTNPRLEREDVVSFSDMASCGTSTAISVPCMFAVDGRDHFDTERAGRTENALDILQRAGVNVLWRDNNSSSKGVADRVPTEDFRSPDRNPDCTGGECFDTGMLVGLQNYVDRHADGDILIVLHQMGSHGPAYYRRYPEAFRQFTPTCDTNQLDNCSDEQIRNTYDNTILYTDHFLAEVIALLRANDGRFETAMLYVSDHGESLGEAGVYLHGLPYFIAPDAQTRVASVLWLGEHFVDARLDDVRRLRDSPLSHDDVFHTLLGLFEVSSQVYDVERDILRRSTD